MSLSQAEAKVQLALLNSGTAKLNRMDTIVFLTNMDLPQEVITRIEVLWEKTKVIAGQVVEIGKIIIAEIIRFINENKNLAIGVAMGAAIGVLVNLVPVLGSLLAPLAFAVGAIVGGTLGARLDRDGDVLSDGYMGIAQEVIIIARKFFELFVDIFNRLNEADL